MSGRVPSVAGALAAFAVLVVAIAAGAQSARPRVRITGYINVSSGCQAETVAFLKGFAAKHPRDVSLEIVDFGSYEGFERWRADGLNCETILINGSSQFRLGSGASARIVVFRMPEGVRWTFDDMRRVLAQELQAPGSAILSDEEASKLARRTPVAWRRGTWKGKPVGEVVVGAQTVFRFNGAFAGASPVQRAQAASGTLKRLYAGGLSSSEILLGRRDVNGEPHVTVRARDKDVAVITDAEADVVRRPPPQAAQFWAFNLREALRTLGR